MEYESIDKFECSPEKCMGVYQHPQHKDFTLWHLFNGAYWVINDNDTGMERLPDNLENPEKWFVEEFSGSLTEEVKALWDKQKAREADNFAKVALTAAYNAIHKQLKWIDANKGDLSEDDHKFAFMLEDELTAINKTILRNIQAA